MTSLLVKAARSIQHLDRWIPRRWRLPIRFNAQRALGELEPEIDALPLLLAGRDGIAIDIGANFGIYTYAFARLGREVYAFEPQPACAETLGVWAARHPSIKIFNAGLGECLGMMTLHVPINARGRPVHTRASFLEVSGPHTEQVLPVLALDDLELPPVALMKIDVEGLEAAVLRGSAATIDRYHPALIVEINRHGPAKGNIATVESFLAEHSYACHAWIRRQLTPLPGGPASAPMHINNFIYLPRPS
jgi:methyltransferase, FkbM family